MNFTTNFVGKLRSSSFQTAKCPTICSSKKLFVPFSHQTVCPYSNMKTANFLMVFDVSLEM